MSLDDYARVWFGLDMHIAYMLNLDRRIDLITSGGNSSEIAQENKYLGIF